ncbi:Retrovirus-related Pol polyprotein from transposon RE2 [Sesamum angolense]|uniref:Retrovirus-related Pol polyprotein from transposon RE2 n=1 Tax=Sesamum angolense TaxID=2727404 RepID=A0AAE2BK29_9LAMI|nr:Retrovirus-related Pol polyprotein from transposon RE2 [Sesamum angolense]
MASSSHTVPENASFSIGSGNDVVSTRINALEYSGMIMISSPLNGNNWLSWSRSVRIELEARDKLGFIDGTCVRPADGAADLRQWVITDSTVRTWILNTISKDIVNAFLYANSAHSLWLELEARYGGCDGTLLYKIQRDISTTSQDQVDTTQLIQFLMGLNEPFDNIRSQILTLEPLPSVNKAYSMILRVERQRQVNMEFTETGENSVMYAKPFERRDNTGSRNFMRHKGPVDKKNLFCEVCNKQGHSKETCFKILVTEIIQPKVEDKNSGTGNDLVAELMEALRLVQSSKLPQEPVKVHFAHMDEMAGMDLTSKHILAIGNQIDKLYYWNKRSFASDSSLTFQQAINLVTWSFLMHTKSETVNILSSFITKISTQFDVKVKSIRTDNDSLSVPSSPSPPLRRSLRQPHPPAWLVDFQCHSSTSHSFDHPVLASSHVQFMAALSTVQEPKTYIQAKGCPEWEEANKQELAALDKNCTWEIVDMPSDKKAIGSKFFPVAKAVTVRTHLVVAASFGWAIHQADVNNAFLHEFLDEEIYMTAPDGYPIPPGKVYKLRRSLYGLKQASKQWNQELTPATPLPLGIKLTVVTDSPLLDPEPYRRLVGRLLYLSFMRPDISYGAQQLRQFVHKPCKAHMDATTHLKTKKQTTVATFTAEAEYRSMGTTAAVHIVANPVFHQRTKHLEIDCHLVRDKFEEGFVLPSHILGDCSLPICSLSLSLALLSSQLYPSWARFVTPLSTLGG